MTTERRASNGRAYAVTGLVLGGATSVSANLAHAVYVQPHLSLVSVIGALFWPLATLVGFEVVVRPPWPTKGKGAFFWALCRLAVIGVGAVAIVTSYEHMSGLLAWSADNAFAVRYGPAAIDGLMITCAAALLVIERYSAATGEAADAPTAPAPEVQQSAPGPAPLAEETLATVTALTALRAVPAVERPAVVTAPVPEAIEAPTPVKPGSKREQAIELWASGVHNYAEIGRQIGVSRQTAADYFKSN